MSEDLKALENAAAEVREARRRLAGTMGLLQRRMSPAQLAREAWDEVRGTAGGLADRAIDAARGRPALVAGVISGLLLFLGRGRLSQLMEIVAGAAGVGNAGEDSLVTGRQDQDTEDRGGKSRRRSRKSSRS